MLTGHETSRKRSTPWTAKENQTQNSNAVKPFRQRCQDRTAWRCVWICNFWVKKIFIASPIRHLTWRFPGFVSIQLWSFKLENLHNKHSSKCWPEKDLLGFGWPLEISIWGIWYTWKYLSRVATIFKVWLTYGPNLGCIFEKPFGTMFSPEMSIPTPMFSKQWQPSCCVDHQGNQLNGVSTLAASINSSGLQGSTLVKCSPPPNSPCIFTFLKAFNCQILSATFAHVLQVISKMPTCHENDGLGGILGKVGHGVGNPIDPTYLVPVT